VGAGRGWEAALGGAAALRAARVLGQHGGVAAWGVGRGGVVGPAACGRARGAGSTAAWGSTA
jgi:hypothetical protein